VEAATNVGFVREIPESECQSSRNMTGIGMTEELLFALDHSFIGNLN
jgi:hypothetical protein